jgi:hypothetical protein
MRWIFCEPGSPDYPHKELALRHIAAWWQAFAKQANHLDALFSQRAQWDLPGWMHSTLNRIHPELMWEFGPGINGGKHRLVITPESARRLRPLVATILKQAPQIPGWEFYPYRLPESLEMAQMTVEARAGGNLEGVMVRPTIGEGNRIDLEFFSPRAEGPDDQQALHEVFVATETLLGEENLDQWVGAIDVAKLPPTRAPNMLPLARLRDTFAAAVQSVIDQLPPQPYAQARVEDQPWAVFELEPESADDYAHRDDMLCGIAIDSQLAYAMQTDSGFFSPRFSRCRERFCYVKIDGEGADIQERFQERGDLEEALNEALVEHNLGCQIGGGTGLRYSYIDLALTDVPSAIHVVRNVLAGRVSLRSWLLFHDADLCGEWIGLYPDSPPPPEPV